MPQVILTMLLFLGLMVPSWAQLTAELLTKTAKVGGTVMIRGSGFGEQRENVTVLFGNAPGKVISARDQSLLVQVPPEAPKVSDIVVEVNGQRSQPMKFECQPSIVLTVGKNPLPVGETTTGVFRVYHSDLPTTIHFVNESPEVVTFVAGDKQTGRTCGGANNIFEFQIVGKGGPRIYDVGYTWTTEAAEARTYTLPWERTNPTRKGP